MPIAPQVELSATMLMPASEATRPPTPSYSAQSFTRRRNSRVKAAAYASPEASPDDRKTRTAQGYLFGGVPYLPLTLIESKKLVTSADLIFVLSAVAKNARL